MTCGGIKTKKKKQKRLQGARKQGKEEELARASSRNMSKWRSMEESAWRLEPEGETEVPEVIIVSDAVESTFR